MTRDMLDVRSELPVVARCTNPKCAIGYLSFGTHKPFPECYKCGFEIKRIEEISESLRQHGRTRGHSHEAGS